MTPYDTTFYPLFAVACTLTVIAMFFSARTRKVKSVVYLLAGIGTFWIGTTIALDLAYRAWQSMGNPPEEAFADPEPAMMFVLGWIPATVLCLVVRLIFRFILPRTRKDAEAPAAG